MQHMHSCPKYPSLHVLFREQLQVIMQFVSKYELPMLQGHVGVMTPLTAVKQHVPLGLWGVKQPSQKLQYSEGYQTTYGVGNKN